MRVLDAFRPRGATWSGQVIFSPPGPSGGPSKMHLLPGGGVPRVHRARSPVPPRLPRFATPRSVHLFAAVAAGAYPPRLPPNAWSPGAPAPPGPCYWLVASGTPLGWRRGCLAFGVGAWRSAPLLPWRVQCPVRVCAALAAGSAGSGRYQVLCLSRFPHPTPRVPRCVWRAVPSGCPLSSLAGTPFRAVCAFCEIGLVALLVVPACPLRLCALVLPRRPLPPPLGGVACAPRAVPALGAGRAVPRGPCPSACPAPVPCSVWRAWGGRSGPGFPLPGLGLLLRGASEVRRYPSPDCPPTRRADGVRYPRAVCAGVWMWGLNTVPLACMPCGGCVPRGWCGGGPSPGGEWPATVVRGVWCQALSLPRPPVFWGGQPGCRDPCVLGAVGAGVGTQHRFHSVRPCGPALLAIGVAEGRPRGGGVPSTVVRGV